MQHSVNFIAKTYSEISEPRKDENRFSEAGFIEFARQNQEKYSLIDNGHDMLVSTWHSGELVEDYRKTLK